MSKFLVPDQCYYCPGGKIVANKCTTPGCGAVYGRLAIRPDRRKRKLGLWFGSGEIRRLRRADDPHPKGHAA